MTFRPNILLIHADQHRFDCLGAHGHSLLQTPSLNRLAAEGRSFTHAFCPSPVCTPARNSLLFGVWPTQHGAIANHGTEAPLPVQDDLTAFSALLADAGYHLGCVGKWGVHPHKGPTDFGFHEFVPETDYTAWRARQGLPPRRPTHGYRGETDHGIAPEQSRLAWGADRTMEMLARYAQNPQPFFLRWDPSEPHLPNIVPEPYASLYPPEKIPPWPGWPDTLAEKPFAQTLQRQSWGVEDWTWVDWAPIVGRYLGEITLLDAQIGRLLAQLDVLGLAETTYVIYTADHGDMCGAHGMLDKHLVMYDDVMRVPLLIRPPGQSVRGPCNAFVSSALDLAATFCDIANVPHPESYMGRSLLPLLNGETEPGPDCAFAMYHGGQYGLYSQRMVREARWKYVWNATAEDELYDLETDPGELVNLARSPAHAGERRRLRRRLAHWMDSNHDPLCNAWTRPLLLGEPQTVAGPR